MLEGMPLAIELAAGWSRTLPLGDVSAELEHGLTILTTPMRDMPERHRSMHAVFEHSWRMLSPDERSVLRQMSVFRGGCTREAAEVVSGADIVMLSSLVDASWLRLRRNGRYHMHELVRQYCEEKLEGEHEVETGEGLRSIHIRHIDYYTDQMKQSPDRPDQQAELLQAAAPEFANLRMALLNAVDYLYISSLTVLQPGLWHGAEALGTHWALVAPFRQVVATLETHIRLGDYEEEESDLLQRIIANHLFSLAVIAAHYGSVDESMAQILHIEALAETFQSNAYKLYFRSVGLRIRTILALRIGDYEAAVAASLEALQIYRDEDFISIRFIHREQDQETSRVFHQADILASVAHAYFYRGEYVEASSLLRESIELGTRIREERQRGQHCNQLGRLLITLGYYEEAESLIREAELVASTIHDPEWAAIAQIWLGNLLRLNSDYCAAMQYLRKGQRAWRRSRYHRLSVSNTIVGKVHLAEGDTVAARAALEQSITEIEAYDMTNSVYIPEAILGLGYTELAEGKLCKAGACFRKVLATDKCAAWEKTDAIAGLAEVAASEGRIEEAIELLALVVAHPFTAYDQREKSRQSLATLQDKVGPSVYTGLVYTGTHGELQAVIDELLDATRLEV